MARKAPAISCSLEDRQKLERLAGSRSESKQMIERAQIILGCLAGRRVQEVARTCHTRPNTVIKWRQRFPQHGRGGVAGGRRRVAPPPSPPRPNPVIKWRQRFAQHGLAGLADAPRPGAKPLYGAD